jgi:flavin-dependent dehydrogenase
LGVEAVATTPSHFRRDLLHNLWQAARDCGARVIADTRALKVLFSGGQTAGLRVELSSGKIDEIACPQIIDASGHDSLLATQLGLVHPLADNRQAIIWAAYEEAALLPECLAGLQFPVAAGRANFRLVPAAGGLTCLSLVGDAEYLLAGRGTPEEIFEDELVLCPDLAERLLAARLVDRFLVAIREPFTLRQSSGAGWQIIGDAKESANPLDPGALSAAILAGRDAAQRLARPAHGLPQPRLVRVPAADFAC